MKSRCVIKGDNFTGTIPLDSNQATNLDQLIKKGLLIPTKKSLKFPSGKISITTINKLGITASLSVYRGVINIECWSNISPDELHKIGITFESLLFTAELENVNQQRDKELSRRLKEEFNHQCMSCCVKLDTHPEPRTDAHHVIPLYEGGPDTEANIVILCPNCHAIAHQGLADSQRRLWRNLQSNHPAKYDEIQNFLRSYQNNNSPVTCPPCLDTSNTSR